MKYVVISEKEEVVSAFIAMGVEAVLATSDRMAIDAVKEAIDCRKTGTLVLSDHVQRTSPTGSTSPPDSSSKVALCRRLFPSS